MNDKHSVIELKEKRFAIHDDQDSVPSRSLGMFKRATGGGTLSGRSLYKNECKFKATAIHLITTNESIFRGLESHGDWHARRRITVECKVKPKKIETNLQQRFASEIGASKTRCQVALNLREFPGHSGDRS
jgi:putative DNA primase/helicase